MNDECPFHTFEYQVNFYCISEPVHVRLASAVMIVLLVVTLLIDVFFFKTASRKKIEIMYVTEDHGHSRSNQTYFSISL